MDREDINIIIGVIGFISTTIAGYIGIKLKETKSSLSSEIIKDVDNRLNKNKEQVESDVEEKRKSMSQKLEKFEARLRDAENTIGIINDRVKGIYSRLDAISKNTSAQIDKLESIMVDGFKDLKIDADRKEKEHRNEIRELYKRKKD